jgi:hypothetical protein
MPRPPAKTQPAKPPAEPVEVAQTNGHIEMAEIPFRGRTFTIPVDMDEWETEACLAMGQSDYVLAAKILLGTGQWALLQSLGSKRKDIREFLLSFATVVEKDCRG